MPLYPFHCIHPECWIKEPDGEQYSASQETVFLHTHTDYSEAIFPSCPRGHGKMARIFDYGGITNRSKGVFPRYVRDLETPELGDKGPVYCSDYQDFKRKLKERNLREKEPTKNTAHAMGVRWV